MDQHNRFRMESLGIFVIALLLFTLGIWDQQPQGFDGRWAVFMQEMFRHGASLFPTTYGEPYPDYPGTATYLSYLFARLFGAPNDLANVMPTAMASAGVMALIYRLLVPSGRAWALLTVLLTALTAQLLEKSRSVCLDQMVSLLCLGAFYLLHTGERMGSRLRQYAVFPLFVVAFAIRGPLGLIEVCGVVCVYWALGPARTRQERIGVLKKVIAHGVIGLILLAGCWWLLLKLARISGGEAFVDDVLRMQFAGRLDESGEAFYFYFKLSLYRYFPVVPLALATMIALRHKWSMRNDDADVQLMLRLAACGLMILVGLSVPHFKRAYYIVPMVPMFAAVAAYGLLQAQGWLLRVRRGYEWLVAVLPVLGIVVVFVCRHLWHKHGYWPDVSVPALVGVLIVLQLAAGIAWRRLQGSLGQRLVVLSLIALATQWLVLVKVVEPAKDLQYDTKNFVGAVEKLRADSPGTLVFVDLAKDTWAIRYIMNLDHDEQPLFIGRNEPLLVDTLPRPAWVIVERKQTALLSGTPLEHMAPVSDGRLNDNPLLVFLVK
ncbi:glycosyltransferase family 39 protein [Pseudomonas sp. CBSPBW29]|uniref:ArnT family glycosyltransferase n=1 Tax=Pseudomonas TaxID=286 RepID=UPI0021AC6252|nr:MULTISPECIES: glycosyltransferase family 39 protein [unclassified Pseudomonas]WEL40323.1 glycosyltransferase family 39 protein [Pseudomonas sp. CBSPBW29]WEL67070.1 glycosyltransferase family 39 protein [Pseudomonas sp. CBSPGW29]WEL70572.1 glycosyltransferase family 39 protein [Pseudomonas sp. CBSPCGW29]WEL77493.1 glycosyltransferase family 39 protein [Pseudomonas sp. CBSPAW29]WEL86724.1 glycosyltransferase family 39 protein [Pseudomonas sp. CBSPCBW29]